MERPEGRKGRRVNGKEKMEKGKERAKGRDELDRKKERKLMKEGEGSRKEVEKREG